MIEALRPLALAHLSAPDDPAPLAALGAWLRGLDPADLPIDAAWAALGTDRWKGHDLWVDPQGRFELGLFVLAPGAAIPIHDHPGMTVLTRVVTGALEVRSWDHPAATRSEARTLGPHDPPHLTRPDRANLHRLEAPAPAGCAFMDLFLPPYGEGRRCSYYALPPAGPDGLQRLQRLG